MKAIILAGGKGIRMSQLTEKEIENESLKQQIDVMKTQNLYNSEKSIKESTNEISKQVKFSLVKWLFDDENEVDS